MTNDEVATEGRGEQMTTHEMSKAVFRGVSGAAFVWSGLGLLTCGFVLLCGRQIVPGADDAAVAILLVAGGLL